ncbi:MAG TPA: copper resistance CopC family protein [Verrucomicrobiae bacterium]|nr:copper resistance CopC family protein [Verrucomicrobiae bacterium]
MTVRPVRFALVVAQALLLLSGLSPVAVLGHAELATASPADKSTVAGSPPELVFTFTEPVDPAKSSLKLVNSANAIVAQGSTVDPADAKKMHLVVPPQPPGAYTVRWTTASALDGDIAHGETTFTIVAASPSPSVAPSTAPSASAEPAASSPSAAEPSPSPSPSAGTTPTSSSSDAVIPVIVALIVLAVLGLWLLRSRSRRVG